MLTIATAGLPFVGIGLMQLQDEGGSWTTLVPFVLIAVVWTALIGTVFEVGNLGEGQAVSPAPQTGRGRWLYVSWLLMIPLFLVMGATVSFAIGERLTGWVFLVMAVAPTALRVHAFHQGRRDPSATD